MIRFSPRARALRQLSALRRLATSPNAAEAESARLKADRVQRRYRITEEALRASDVDASHAAEAEGWGEPWQLALLGALGDHAEITVTYDLPGVNPSTPGKARLRGVGAGRVLREATTLRDHVATTLTDPAIPTEVAETPVTLITVLGSLQFQQVGTLASCFGDDATAIFAVALVQRGVARVAQKLRADVEALARLDAQEAARAARAVQEPPGPPPPGEAPPPVTPVTPGPPPPPPPPPDLALIAFHERLHRLKNAAAQLLGTPVFAGHVDRRVDTTTWDACGDRLAGEEAEDAVVIRGLLIDREHERGLARATRRTLVSQVCADLTAATRRSWHPVERDPDGAQTADGMQRISIGPACFLVEPTGVRPLGVVEGEPGWRARLVEAVRSAS